MTKAKTARVSRIIVASFIVLTMAFMGAGCTWFGPKVGVIGRVIAKDELGKVIPIYKARVTIGRATPVYTDYDGTFEAVGVKTGKQMVTIEKEGFEPFTKTVDISADNTDLGDLEIVAKDGTKTIEVAPDWTFFPVESKSMADLGCQTASIEVIPDLGLENDDVIGEATLDVVLEQDDGRCYTAGARVRLVSLGGFGIKAEYDGSLIIMGIEDETAASYTITATGTAGSDLDIFKQKNIVIEGQANIGASQLVDDTCYDLSISLNAFLQDRS